MDKMFYNCIMEGKALPDYSETAPYQVNLTFKAPILDAAFVIFIRNEQNRSPPAGQLNVFELLTLYKVAMRDYEGLERHLYQSYILSYAKIRNYRLNPYFLLEEIKKSFSSFIRRGLQAYYLHAPMVQSCNGYPFPYAAVPRLRPRGCG